RHKLLSMGDMLAISKIQTSMSGKSPGILSSCLTKRADGETLSRRDPGTPLVPHEGGAVFSVPGLAAFCKGFCPGGLTPRSCASSGEGSIQEGLAVGSVLRGSTIGLLALSDGVITYHLYHETVEVPKHFCRKKHNTAQQV